MQYKIGVIGFGVMGQAIISRIIASGKLNAGEICAYDSDEDKLTRFIYNIHIADSVEDLVRRSERVMFAVKPQHYGEICSLVDFNSVKTAISIMAGVKTSTLREKLKNNNAGIVRIMPNTPCALGKGVCGVYFDKTDKVERDFIVDLMTSCGGVVAVAEEKFDAVTSVSGSGPAYVYLFADGMIKGGMNGGLSYEESRTLALDTIIGAAELAKRSEEPMETLIERVCSKGGTTIEAVEVYRSNNLTELIAEGVDACREKSVKLSERM